MKKTWLVAASTFRRRVRSTTFLALTFGMPLLMAIAGTVPVMTELRGALPRIGYVDQTGQFGAVEQVPVGDETLEIAQYPDVGAAGHALQAGDIGGYLVIPDEYFEGVRPTFYGERRPNARLEEGMTGFLRRAMLPEAPSWVVDRLDDPSQITYVALETQERIVQGPGLVIRVATPAFLAIVFLLSVFTSANQMGSAVVREKEHRAMEMVITSLAPRQLVTGKILGMALLSLAQLTVWVLGALLGLRLALLGTLRLQDVSIPWSAVVWAALLGIPGYLLYAVIGAGLGVIAGDKQQARQLSGMLGFVGMGPLYFLGAIIDNLGGTLGIALTLFPLTAPTIALIRMTLSEVPAWQFWASLSLILACLGGSVWFVTRIFRATMLLYGQALNPAEIWRALRQA